MPESKEQRYPPIQTWRFGFFVGAIKLLVRLLAKLRVEGLENVPADRPLIFVTNHLHYLDTPLVGPTLPREVRALAGERYEKHIFGILLTSAGCIYINRGEVDRSALRQAFNVLEDGLALTIAIEGTRSKSGELTEGKTGAAYIATRMNVPLLPVVVTGTEQIIPAWKRLRRANVHVRYGPPFYLPEGRARAADLDNYTEEIMVTLAAMLPPDYRGMFADHPLLEEKLPVYGTNSPD